jgi:hypothetical protein
MTRELREILQRFDAMPDDGVVSSRITAIILGLSGENGSLSHAPATGSAVDRPLRPAGWGYSEARAGRDARAGGRVMASGIIPWTRQLELCTSWLEIISDELVLRGQELDAEGAEQLAVKAATLSERAQALFASLDQIAKAKLSR